MQNLLFCELGIIQSICDMDDEEMRNSVGDHLCDWQALNHNLAVFRIENVEESTSNFETAHAT